MDWNKTVNWLQREAHDLDAASQVGPEEYDSVEAYATALVDLWEQGEVPGWYGEAERRVMVEHIIRSYG